MTTSQPYGTVIIISAKSTTLAYIASAFLDGSLLRREAVPVHIISLSAGAIIGAPLSGLKAVLGGVAPLLEAKAVLGDVVPLLVVEAVLEGGVQGDKSR
jgi:hypothetical protein